MNMLSLVKVSLPVNSPCRFRSAGRTRINLPPIPRHFSLFHCLAVSATFVPLSAVSFFSHPVPAKQYIDGLPLGPRRLALVPICSPDTSTFLIQGVHRVLRVYWTRVYPLCSPSHQHHAYRRPCDTAWWTALHYACSMRRRYDLVHVVTHNTL